MIPTTCLRRAHRLETSALLSLKKVPLLESSGQANGGMIPPPALQERTSHWNQRALVTLRVLDAKHREKQVVG